MPTFAQIQHEIQAMLDTPDEELTDEQPRLMDEYLAELGSAEAAKVDSFARFVRLASAQADALRAEAARLQARAKAVENRIDGLRGHYLQIMARYGPQKVTGEVHTLSTRTTNAVEVLNETAVPQEFPRVKTTTEPDKAAIKAALPREVYGQDDLSSAEKVRVRITFREDVYADRGPVVVCDRTIAYARGRDSGARLGDGVLLVAGTVTSGGSMRYWKTVVRKGTVVDLEVAKPLLDAHEVSERYTIDVLPATGSKREQLLARREKLLAELATLDKALAETEVEDNV